MRVEPELLIHNKFIRFKRIVGDIAMESLIRLWSHCQTNKRGEFWPGADADDVELQCDWQGERGVLFRALLECGGKRSGFIEVVEGGILIHDWNAMNATFTANWKNGTKGGRPKTKDGNPLETQSRNGLAVGLAGGSKGGSKQGTDHNRVETQCEPTGNPLETQCEPTAPNLTRPNLTVLSRNTETEWKPTGNPLVLDDYGMARHLVALLNELTGAKFELPLNELDAVVRCLLDTNRDFSGMEKMLRRQVALWRGDAKARHWLKPGTLFGPKFHDYYGQRELATDGNGKTAPNKTRPRAEVLHELGMAREQGASPDDIQNLERELATA
jgi:uncharacterized phage protein (TIGR02220 family)